MASISAKIHMYLLLNPNLQLKHSILQSNVNPNLNPWIDQQQQV